VLGTFAEVAVTLAGFVGIALVLRRNPAADRDDHEALVHLLGSSLGVAGFALLPLIAQSAWSDPATVWRACTPALGIYHLYGAWRGWRDSKRGRLRVPKPVIATFGTSSLAVFAASVAIAAGGLSAQAPLIYLAALMLSLVVGVAVFVPLVFRGNL
jgi:hypothetical protein